MDEEDAFMKANPMRGDVSPVNRPLPKAVKPTPSAGKSKSSLKLDDIESSVSKPKSRSPPPSVTPPRLRKGYSKGVSQTEDVETEQSAVHGSGDIELGTPVGGDHGDAAATSSPAPRQPRGSSKRATSAQAGEKLGRNPVERKSDNKASRFKGAFPLQYALWGHYMAYGAGLLCLAIGLFSMVWTDARTYKCKIDNKLISDVFLLNAQGNCSATFVRENETKFICCDPNSETDLKGYLWIGLVYVIYSLAMLVCENTMWGFGLWYPTDTVWYRNRISPVGVCHCLLGIAGLYNYATCFGGACLLSVGVVYMIAAWRCEAGDGGRGAHKPVTAAVKAEPARSWAQALCGCCGCNLSDFWRRSFNQDRMATYFWVTVFVICNIVVFVYAFQLWVEIVEHTNEKLKDGTLDVSCTTRLCHYNRKAVRYGPISRFAPWAKGFGTTLNFQCTMLLFPVVKHIIRKINNWGVSFHASQQANDWVGRFFAHPLTRYIPLGKNIDFHIMCAWSVFVFSWGHLFFHLLNLYESNNATMAYFRLWRWDGTYLFSGAMVTWAMLMLYSAAFEDVRRAKFEIFFTTHKWMFVVFFAFMFHHGPNFFYWSVVPVLLYLYEKFLVSQRGRQPWTVIRVEWISPVLAVYLRPVFKDDFVYKEGQYLYLNCPAISASEWHPFTISSATDDMNNPVRVHLETGEEVVEVPRPKGLPANAKWSKFCLASQDWQALEPHELLDKSDTGFFDYVSLHIKVFGLDDPVPRSWTRKLKDYFELLSPGNKFPFYFHRRDARGEVLMGRQFGPDSQQPIVRVDGPHSAPAEHYVHYGTVMLVGAGIGLTPCVSILTALTKYRWRKNFNPELLHFYWIVRHNEVESYQWLVHALTELSFELKRARASGQIERRYYCEINIYVTAVERERKDFKPLARAPRKRFVSSHGAQPSFFAEDLYARLVNPTVESRGQVKKMKEGGHAENRLQDIWVWNGRPQWDEVFREMKEQRQHSDIGVCFCGSPAIGQDLRVMCEKYSSADEDCLFSLHKENF